MGLLARGIEQQGIPTLYVGVMLDFMKITNLPRAAFVDFPVGRPFGRPGDRSGQLAVLRDALGVLTTAHEPGTLVQLPHAWGEPFTFVPGRAPRPPRE